MRSKEELEEKIREYHDRLDKTHLDKYYVTLEIQHMLQDLNKFYTTEPAYAV